MNWVFVWNKAFNLHFPVNQLMIFPECNIGCFEWSLLAKIRIYDINGDDTIDFNGRWQQRTPFSKRPRRATLRWRLTIQERTQGASIGARAQDPHLLSLLGATGSPDSGQAEAGCPLQEGEQKIQKCNSIMPPASLWNPSSSIRTCSLWIGCKMQSWILNLRHQ